MKITANKVLFLITGWLVSIAFSSRAQNGYNLVGTARASATSDCYQLTQAAITQNGAVWYEKPIQLSTSFEVEFTLNFGNNRNGADGIVMVMQVQGNQILGIAGQGIGFQGLTPSLGVEFDTHRNGNLGDPVADHVAVVRDGNSNHQTSEFNTPVPISTRTNNVKDGNNYLVKVKWDARAKKLDISVDCVLRISQSVDLVNDIFKGRQEVYWGFTSSTGSSNNAHSVCLLKDIIKRDTLQACRGESLTLSTNPSSTNGYQWSPATGLSDPTSRTPQLKATTDQLYTVRYVDRCSIQKTDSVFVDVRSPSVDLGVDQSVCEKEEVVLTPTLTPATAGVQFLWSTGETTRQVRPKTSGQYTLKVTANGCSDSDSVRVTFNPLPKLDTVSRSIFDCPRNQPLVLDPRATGSGLRYSWTPDNTTEPTLSVSIPGLYTVNVQNEFGCSAKHSYTILDNCPPLSAVYVPSAFSPNGDGHNEVFEWKSNEIVEARMSVFNRWGELVFWTENAQDFWNGSSKGAPCPASIYAWKLEYRSAQSKTGEWVTKQGTVVLVR